MLTIDFNAIRAIMDALRAERDAAEDATVWAEMEATTAAHDIATAEAYINTDPDAMDALYDANDAACAAYHNADEQERAIRAVYHAFGQAVEMLTDYITDYKKDGE